MKLQLIKKTITTGRYTLAIAGVAALTFWVVSYFLFPDLPRREISYSVWNTLHAVLPAWADPMVCFLLYAATGYYMMIFNNRFGLIQLRAATHLVLFFLLLSVWPGTYVLYAGDVASLCFLVSVYHLFGGYQQSHSPGHLFHAAFFTGLGSLFYPQLTFFLPVLLMGAYSFRSLSVRGFLATLVGWSVPYWFLFGYAFSFDTLDLFYRPFIELVHFSPIDFRRFQLWELVTLGYVFLLCVISSVHSFVTSYRDKIRTRVYLRFFMMLSICVLIFMILQPAQYMNLLTLLLVGTSILTGHLFVLADGKTAGIFFIVSMLCLLFLFFFNIWMLLSTSSSIGGI